MWRKLFSLQGRHGQYSDTTRIFMLGVASPARQIALPRPRLAQYFQWLQGVAACAVSMENDSGVRLSRLPRVLPFNPRTTRMMISLGQV
jgi:hypothetical protein